MSAPPLADSIVATALDPAARRDLGGLQKDLAEAVARHLVAAGSLVDEDPQAALAHARYARRRASRIAVVREAAGIAAYHAGEWAEALAELRAARRMGGGPGHLAVMADVERAMGRPERAIEVARGPEARELARDTQVELAIVVAGARRDLGELDAAVVGLQIPELDPARRDPWSARLFYAYADNLLAAGRESDALQWFVHAMDADADGETDADARVADLTGEPLPDDGIEFGIDDEHDDVPDETAAADGAPDSESESADGLDAAADGAPDSATESADALDAAADEAPDSESEPADALDATADEAPDSATESADALDEAAAAHDAPARVTESAGDNALEPAAPTSDDALGGAATALDETAADDEAPDGATEPAGVLDDAADGDHDAPAGVTESAGGNTSEPAPGHAVGDAEGGLDEASVDDESLASAPESAGALDESAVSQGEPAGATDSAGGATEAVVIDPGEAVSDSANDEAAAAGGGRRGATGSAVNDSEHDARSGTVDAADDEPTGEAVGDAAAAEPDEPQTGSAAGDVNGSAHGDGAPDVPNDLTTLTDVEGSVPDRTAGR